MHVLRWPFPRKGSLTADSQDAKTWGRMTLHREFVVVSVLIVLIVTTLSISFSYRLYSNIVDRFTEKARSDAEQLDAYLHEHFEFAEFLMERLGRNILESGRGAQDINHISQLLRLFSEDTTGLSALTTSVFSWANTDNLIVVKPDGSVVMDDPIDASQRAYVTMGRQEPWTMHFSPPDIGIVSGKKVIPAGMGITDKDGSYVGTIASGFLQERMVTKIKTEILSPGYQFALYDQNNVLALKSDESPLLENDLQVLDLLHDARKWRESQGVLRSPSLVSDESEYCYFYRSLFHPYLILVTFDRSMVVREVMPILGRTLMELAVFSSLLILLLFWAKQRFINPVTRLSTMAQQYSSTHSVGDRELSANNHRDSYEISQLTQQFDRVRYVEELERIRKELTYKTRLSESRKDAAETAIRSRAELLGNMGHELRGPLNSIMAYSESIRDQVFGVLDNKKYLQYAGDIHQAGEQLQHLISDIIDLSLIDADNFPACIDEVRMEDVLEALLLIIQPVAVAQNVHLQTHCEADLPPVQADYARLIQALEHISHYTIMHAPEDGRVTLSVAPHASHASIEIIVADSGEGMRKADILKVLGRYTTASTTKTPPAKHRWDLDIQLPLARKLIELMGGMFAIEAVPESGTRFVLTFDIHNNREG